MAIYGISGTGFTLKRLYDIKQDLATSLSTVQDPNTGEMLTVNLTDENDPLVQIVNALADQLSVCWEQLQLAYDQFDPLKSTGNGLSTLVQLNGIQRKLGETDTSLRLRQQNETGFTGLCQADSIYAGVRNINGVEFCRVYQNSTLEVDTRGLTGKSISCVIVGGSNQDIADSLFWRTPVGITYYGNTNVVCYDLQNNPYTISFMRPTPVVIKIEVTLNVVDQTLWPSDGENQIKEQIIQYAKLGQSPTEGFAPGVDVTRARLYTPVNNIPGHVISSIRLAEGSGSLGDVDITVDWNQIASISAANITVVT